VILAAGTPQILLPWDNAAVFSSNLQLQSGAQLATWTAWQAPASMKPSEVAKRVGMSELELRTINNIPTGVLIKAGSTLLVARSAAMRQDVTEHVADTAQLTLSPLPLLARRGVRASKGDTVASVAQRHRVDAASVAEWNQVALTASFKSGQALTLFLPARAKGTSVAAATGPALKKSRAARGKPLLLAKR